MPFEPTWTREEKDYLEYAYKNDIPLKEVSEKLKRSVPAVSEYAASLGLTDKDRALRIRHKTGHAKITPALVAVIEELIIDWGYSAARITKVLASEYETKLSKSSVLLAIQTRVSDEAKSIYVRRWSKYSKYKPMHKKRYTKKGPEFIKQAKEKYREQRARKQN